MQLSYSKFIINTIMLFSNEDIINTGFCWNSMHESATIIEFRVQSVNWIWAKVSSSWCIPSLTSEDHQTHTVHTQLLSRSLSQQSLIPEVVCSQARWEMISVSVIFTLTLYIACFNKSLRPSSGDQMRGNSSSQLLHYMNNHTLLKNNSYRKVWLF